MKIFEIRWSDRDGFKNEKSWVAALTPIEAIKTYTSTTNLGLFDFENEDDIVELPKEKWNEHFITDENGKKEMTFAEWIENYPNDSCIICETVGYEDLDFYC